MIFERTMINSLYNPYAIYFRMVACISFSDGEGSQKQNRILVPRDSLSFGRGHFSLPILSLRADQISHHRINFRVFAGSSVASCQSCNFQNASSKPLQQDFEAFQGHEGFLLAGLQKYFTSGCLPVVC